MSSPTASTTAAPAPTAATKTAESVAAKVQKHVDGLHAKISKLAADNAALKAQLHEAKASNSRIRRIPKKPAAAAAPAQ